MSRWYLSSFSMALSNDRACRVHKIGGSGEQDPVAVLDERMTEGGAEVRFPDPLGPNSRSCRLGRSIRRRWRARQRAHD